MKTKILLALLMVVIGGCYRPHWYRANTTYAELKADSNWCKSQTQIGASRSEVIAQYEVCMKAKGYELKEKDPYSGGEPIRVEGDTGPIIIDKNTNVYVGIYSGGGRSIESEPAYRYFHKKDCKHLLSVSAEQMTAGKAIAQGKIMCPDCFR